MTTATCNRSKLAFHDVEHGGYRADLPLWLELAASAQGPILDLGAGSGRVAVVLAEAGHDVVALDIDGELLSEAGRRAEAAAGTLTTKCGDARELAWPRSSFGLVIAPMQFLHLLGGESGRAALLARLLTALRPGGLLAAAILADEGVLATGPADRALPDIREVDGYVHSSLPLGIRADTDAIYVDRLRHIVSPNGDLGEEAHTVRLDLLDADTLEAEAAACGFVPAGRRPISETDEHVGSVCVLLETPDGR